MKRVALITGGTRGIGLGIAGCLAGEGINLALCGMRERHAVADAVAHLQSLGAEVLYVRADIGDSAARSQLIDAVRDHFGRLDVLVNNAGMAPKVRADLLDASQESFHEIMRTNLEGPYFLTQLAARWMIEQRTDASQGTSSFSPSIVNVTSVSATMASINRGDYCISKAGLAMATQLWAARLGEYHIPVYEVRPGIVHTDMTATVEDKYDKMFAEGLAIDDRWGTPEDVGKAVAALVRGDFPYSTGQVFVVDGGLSVPRL